MDTKLIEKIKKLLALSESSNENEAKIAMLKAQELLAKYKLSMKEIKEYKINNTSIKNKISNVSFRQGKWKAELGDIIAENFGCYWYLMKGSSKTIVFFGKEEDTLVCNIVLEYAVDCILSTVKKLRYQYYKDGYSTKGLENDYALGFISGLEKMFKEQKKKNQEWGLVLVKAKEVVEAYNNINFNGGVNINTTFQGYNDAYYQGKEDGENFSISDKITEEETEEQLTLPASN